MIFLSGMFGGAVIALTVVAVAATFWPKRLKSFLFSRDDGQVDFSRGTIYRKGQDPEQVG